jgi:hypothetical protein
MSAKTFDNLMWELRSIHMRAYDMVRDNDPSRHWAYHALARIDVILEELQRWERHPSRTLTDLDKTLRRLLVMIESAADGACRHGTSLAEEAQQVVYAIQRWAEPRIVPAQPPALQHVRAQVHF